jgi:transposase-like protein
MPWKECSVVDERMKFVARFLDGESMAALCREFGIARKTGYKIVDRYQSSGVEGLVDRSRRPVRYGNQLPIQVEKALLQIKADKPSSGSSEDPRTIHSKVSGYQATCQEHDSCIVG